jgi:hypothetical protein
MTMVDDMINTVRAAFTPDADAATKRRAAGILRGLLGMLEPTGVTAARGTEAPAAPTASATPRADLLTTIVEYVRPHLPPEAFAEMPRFRVPLIDLARHR